LDNDPLSRVRAVPLYQERYVLITHEPSFLEYKSISWAQAAALPLCLLTPSMQNRRIIDAQFRAAGAQINAVMETNSLVTLWSHLQFGRWSTVVPQTFLLLFERKPGTVSIPLVEPEALYTLGMVAADREPLAPLTRAFLEFAQHSDLTAAIEQRINFDTQSKPLPNQRD
jgi:DNA-binding transcriptional LysR family regulator